MAKIKHLPDEVINQIAAGEVVERPASVVKELVENSLDAGATRFEIYIEEGGKRLIRVVDNGGGIAKNELAHAVNRHWTSKISSSDDLSRIGSLGFRGEALASIASVSEFSIASRTQEAESGWRISVSGKVQNLTLIEVGMSVGTEVVVQGLFYNLPARRNFLKHERTEFAHITELIYQLALVHPKVAFVFYHNGKKVFQSAGGDTLDRSVLTKVLGEELSSRLLAVRGEHPQASVTGWVGQPGTGSARRAKQYVFVNRRPVENRLIWGAVSQAYGSFIGRHEKPQFVLMLEVAPHLVDVNVHPQKKEVKFAVGDTVFRLVRDAVYSALAGVAVQREQHTAGVVPSVEIGRISSIRPIQPRKSGNYLDLPRPKATLVREPTTTHYDATQTESLAPSKVFQVLNLFLIEEVENGIRVYDQHAIHERVLYNRFAKMFLEEKDRLAAQLLLIPVEIELSPTEMATWEEADTTLARLGFAVEKSGETSIRITQVPTELAQISLQDVFLEVLSDLSDLSKPGDSPVKQIDDQTHRRLAYLACRSAVKAGDRLNELEAAALLNKFRQAEFASTCPHGRPVMVKIDRKEMEKWFRR